MSQLHQFRTQTNSAIDQVLHQAFTTTVQNKALVGGALAALYVLSKVVPLMKQKQEFDRLSEAPNKEYFPQFHQNAQGMWLYSTEWLAQGKPKALIFIVHGFAEHVHRYEPVGRHYASKGFAVHALDHQGHGQSQGTRTFVERFQQYVDDYIQFVATVQARPENKDVPAFLLGHSMGGCIALNVMRQTWQKPETGVKLQGLILSAPAIWVNPKVVTPSQRRLSAFFSSYLPRFIVGKLPAETLSTIQLIKDQYGADKLNTTTGMMARWAQQITATMDEQVANYGSIDFPFMLLHGTGDRIVDPTGSKQMHEEAKSADKELLLQEGIGHESFNDVKQAESLRAIEQWITKRLPKGASGSKSPYSPAAH